MLDLLLFPFVAAHTIPDIESHIPPAIIEEIKTTPTTEPKIIFNEPPKSALCSCVLTAKWILSKEKESWGNAWNIVPDKNAGPEIGNIVITKEGLGHIAVIVSKSDDSILIREGNYKRCQKTERELKLNDPKIKGYKNIDKKFVI